MQLALEFLSYVPMVDFMLGFVSCVAPVDFICTINAISVHSLCTLAYFEILKSLETPLENPFHLPAALLI